MLVDDVIIFLPVNKCAMLAGWTACGRRSSRDHCASRRGTMTSNGPSSRTSGKNVVTITRCLLFLTFSASLGDGSLSPRPLDDFDLPYMNSISHVWRETDFTDCSVTCGTGVETTNVVCYDSGLDLLVNDQYCDPDYRPSRRIRICFRRTCDRLHTWVTGDWGPCSRTCVTDGVQRRNAYCVSESDDGQSLLPSDDDNQCDLQRRPTLEQRCSGLEDCPTWVPGQWSLCSATCGVGYQLRAVVCQHSAGDQDTSQPCSTDVRPVDRRTCRSRVPCLGEQLLPLTSGNDTDQLDGGALHGGDDNLVDHRIAAILDPYNLNPLVDWRGTEVAENHPWSVQPVQAFDAYTMGEKIVSPSAERGVSLALSAPMATTDKESDERRSRPSPEGQTDSDDASRLENYNKPSFANNDIVWKNPQRRRSSRHVQMHHEPDVENENTIDTPSDGVDDDNQHHASTRRPSEVKDERWPDDSPMFSESFESGGDYYSMSLESVEDVHNDTDDEDDEEEEEEDDEVRIVNDTSNFVQFQRSSIVKLVVGGSATILRHTSVYIVCYYPSDDEHQGKTSVVWTRDGNVITEAIVRGSGNNSTVFGDGLHSPVPPRRLRVGIHHHPGVLRIRNFRKTDAGVYTCTVAGTDHSKNTTLRYHTENEAMAQLTATLAALNNEDGGHEVDEKRDRIREHLSPVDFSERPPRPPDLLLATYSALYMERILGTPLPVFYIPGDWSRCSARCGRGGGIHKRNVTCSLLSDSWKMDFEDTYCEELKRPITESDCKEQGDCPQWEPERWGKCSADTCLGPGLGVRRRAVRCLASSTRDRLSDDQCSPDERPSDSETCPDPACQAVWIPYMWSKCRGTCGRPGQKTRVVRCVWASNKKPTSNDDCSVLKRPASFKPCLNEPCKEPGVTAVCRDEFKLCQMIVVLQMCRYSQFQTGCCRTCSLVAAAAAAAADATW